MAVLNVVLHESIEEVGEHVVDEVDCGHEGVGGGHERVDGGHEVVDLGHEMVCGGRMDDVEEGEVVGGFAGGERTSFGKMVAY